MKDDAHFMTVALDEARKAAEAGEAPIGAVIADEAGEIIAAAGNAPIATHDPTGHAEIRALRAAAEKIGNYRLPDTTLYVTLEPCAMCAGAISIARVRRLVIAATDPKGGAVWHGARYFEQPTCHWRPEVVEGPFGDESGDMLRAFFKARR
jgi:tRNA(adenine34) deaminase